MKGFSYTVQQLEKMVRDPSDVLTEMIERLSSRDLQLVLVYFAQEGRDSYCALEVFDWLKKENRVDVETMELMVSIACGWMGRLIDDEDCDVGDVVELMDEMEFVGLEPDFSMIEKVVCLYWDRDKKEEAVEFVKFVMQRGNPNHQRHSIDGGGGRKGCPVGYLAWKMLMDGKYMDAVNLVIEFKEVGINPEVYSYLIAMSALVKEQKEFSKTLRKLKSLYRLDAENHHLIELYQSNLLKLGARLSTWALAEGEGELSALIHERLLALYTCASCGLEAEQELWELKLSGKEPDPEIYDVVLAICASQNETDSVRRLLAGVDDNRRKSRRSLVWLVRGYLKGGYYKEASETMIAMLELGLQPDYVDRVAVLQGLRKTIHHQSGNAHLYLKLCKTLSDLDLIQPCVVYFHFSTHNLWIINTV